MFKLNTLLITIMSLLVILSVAASIYRFGFLMDYIVAYEGECDPATASCFVDCVDDECTEEYYFTIIERHAAEVYDLCGGEVTECEEAYECRPEVSFCEITYCDPEQEGREACAEVNTDEL